MEMVVKTFLITLSAMRYERSVFPAKSLRFVFLLLAGCNSPFVAEYLLHSVVSILPCEDSTALSIGTFSEI